jgi:hypothetical protein
MKKTNIEKVIGYLLLTPGLLSVGVFLYELLGGRGNYTSGWDLKSNVGMWFFGFYDVHGHEGNQMPLFFGLMAIAGVYLIKDRKE